ncbi:MAG: hypothetical protein GX230_11075 [Lentisphaerae bacterium]|nr:hypothetical protein [Lentisphaerota bacterium]
MVTAVSSFSNTINNFQGTIEALGSKFGGNGNTATSGVAGSLLLPPSAGSGLTLDRMVISNEVHFGNSLAFGTVVVTNGGKLCLAANPDNYEYSFATLNILSGGEVVCIGDVAQANEAAGGSSANPYGRGVSITATNITVASGGALHADRYGFSHKTGPGKGGGENTGAGHGGYGAGSKSETGQGMPYGSAARPTTLGSGGGYSSVDTGSGGGAIKLAVLESIVIDGRLSADGGISTHGSSYGGSGGSIWAAAGTLSGSGVISANGGFNNGGFCGSGGGRIDISETVNNFSGTIEALGNFTGSKGNTATRGTTGSILLPQNGTGLRSDLLVVTNDLYLGNGAEYGKIKVEEGGSLYLDANEGYDLFSCDEVEVCDGGRLVFVGNCMTINETMGGSAAVPYGAGGTLKATNIVIREGGRIDADAMGFPQKSGPGRGPGSYQGAGRGGAGANRDEALVANPLATITLR